MTIRVLAMILVTFSAIAEAQAPAQDDGRYIVTFRPGTVQARRAEAVQRAGAVLRFNYTVADAVAITVRNANALSALAADASVVSIVPDRKIFAIQNPNDALARPGTGGGSNGEVVGEGVKRIGLPTPGSDGSGVGVAIVDTGMDLLHADLLPGGTSFSSFGGSCQDDNGHGTHVAGIVAALDNETGVLGVAPAATPYCVKVLNAQGSGSDSDVIAGLNWVYENRLSVNPQIRVVNMSLGREGTLNDNPAMRQAVQNLTDVAGIALVVAAGNDPNKEVKDMVPAGYPEAFAVASTTAIDGTNKCRWFSGRISADTASYFTTDGPFQNMIGVTISAPGADKENISNGCLISSVGILSLKSGGGTTRSSGTSMASPHVAGVVARLIQTGTLGLESIRSAIRSSANRAGTAPLNSPTSSYTFDGEREGVVRAPAAP